MSDALPLPPRPHLEQYKKLARDLQQACQSVDAGAVRTWATRWVEALSRLQGWTRRRPFGGTKSIANVSVSRVAGRRSGRDLATLFVKAGAKVHIPWLEAGAAEQARNDPRMRKIPRDAIARNPPDVP